MSVLLAIAFGGLGVRFSRLGAQVKAGTGGGAPPGDAPTLQFNAAANSQLLVLLEDF